MSKITLAEFLGWEEDTEYEYEGRFYKVIGTDLVVNNIDGLYPWERVNDEDIKIHELWKLSEEAERVEPKKYHLKHKFLGEGLDSYLNYNYDRDKLCLMGMIETPNYQTQFTDDEIEEIEATGFDLRNFEKVRADK